MSFALNICGYRELTVYGYLRKLSNHIPNEIIELIVQCYLNYFDREYYELTERQFYKTYWIESGKLGSGCFTKNRTVTRKSDNVSFILFMIKKKHESKEVIDSLHFKIDILSKLSHKNICMMQNWCDTKKRIYLVTEKYKDVDIFQMILKHKKFDEKEAVNIIKQIGEGLVYIHYNNIIHRQLNPDNLFYDKNIIKICNFGAETDINSSIYIAPEVLLSKSVDIIDRKIDIWSLGITMYIMLCGFPPFYDLKCNQQKLFESIKLCKYKFPSPYWDNISFDAKDLIKNMLQFDPNKRYSAMEILKHRWISSNNASQTDLGDIYMEQMEHYSSSRQFFESQWDQNANFQDDVQIFANSRFAPKE